MAASAKTKLLIPIICLLLAVVVLAGNLTTPVVAADETFSVHNPLGILEPIANAPLAERTWSDFSGKSIAMVYYSKAQSPQATRALGNLLTQEFDGVETTEYNLGSSIGAKPLGYYDALAEHDAVVIGIADCTLSAWWGAYHAKMIEERGTPTVLLVHEAFTATHDAGKLDNGFTGARRAVIDSAIFSRAATVLRNTDVDYLEEAYAESIYGDVKAALTAELTADEKTPPAITPSQLAGWSKSSGDPTAAMLTIRSTDEVHAAADFNAMAMELGFGDGLPLIMPLPELVDKMLAATTRDRDDVLGRIMPRGGIMTVEKVAINAVMAGARTEYFPAILAAMEAYASSWEDANLLYHSLTSSDNYTLMLLFSGPIVEELDISGQWGFIGSGNEANNAIGRAVRLSARNIGVNRTNVTDGTARQGRQNDHALTVFGEQESLLPDGWERHNELLGFERTQSTVSVLGYYAQDMYFGMGGVNADFNPLSVVSSGATKAGSANVSVMTIPRNVAALLKEGLGPGGVVVNTKAELLRRMGYNDESKLMVYPIVVGDPESARVYTGGPSQYGMAASKFYGMQAFQTRMITGATSTASGTDAAPPAAPTNVEVYYKDGNAYLTWDAPTGATGVRYQVSYTGGAAGGALNPFGALPETVNATPPSPPAPIFTVPQEVTTAYDLGAWPLSSGTYDPALDGNGIPSGVRLFGLFDGSYGRLTPPTSVTGYTKVSSISALRQGAWYLLNGSSGFDYVLIMAERSAPLTYAPATLSRGVYDVFPSWIDVPSGATSVMIPNISESDALYNDFYVRAVDDGVKNASTPAQKSTNPDATYVEPPEVASAFAVGTWPMTAGTYDPALDGNAIPAGIIIYGLFDASYATMPNPTALTGFNKAESIAAMQDGDWYLLIGSSGFNYVLIKAEGGMPTSQLVLDTSASGRGAWAQATIVAAPSQSGEAVALQAPPRVK